MPHDRKARYAIIGAGIAGISAVEAIREVDSKGTILLANGESVSPYCRPLIVEVLRKERTFDDIHLREPGWFQEKSVELVTGDPAVRIHPGEKRLELESGRRITWDRLLIATGSKPVVPPIDGLNQVRACTLWCHEDVERLKSLLRPGARALLIGIGLIGLQAIASLKQLGVETTAVELMPRVLPMILDGRGARYVQQRLEENGVRVHVGATVEKVGLSDESNELDRSDGADRSDRPPKPYQAITSSGERIPFDFVVLSTGMKPDLSLLNGSGIEVDRGIIVSSGMRTNIADVYAAGDVTEVPSWIEGHSEIHAHWVNAYRQGRIVGREMAGGETTPYEPVYLNSLNVFGLPVITMGASRIDEPEGAEVYVSESPAQPAYTRLVVRDGKLIAATFINGVDRAGVFQYLMQEKVNIGNMAESLLEEKLEGMEFLDRLHEKAVRGDIDWPESMDRIKKYRKDHSHTRWGQRD